MAKTFGGGRRNRNTSFGKRQDADNTFRKKKKEGRDDSRGDDKRSDDRRGGERRTYSGSRYEGGARKFSPGRKRDDSGGGEKRPFRPGRSTGSDSASRGYGKSRSYGDKPRGDFGDKPRRSYGDRDDKKPFAKREGRSFDKKPYRSGKPEGGESSNRRSFGDRSKGGYGNKSRGDRGDKPFRPRTGRSFDKPERRSFVESKVESHRERVEEPTRVESKPKSEQQASEDGLIRLNKFISNSGVCSRREADELIKMGVITVNGTTITEMGFKVKPTDDVRHDGKKLTAEKPVYILLNKPKGFITTTDDPQERNTVMELIAGACKERVYPVGRLDRNTTGLLLLTNDGDLTDKLTHPSFNAKKIYKVELDKPLTKADFEKIIEGVKLEEGKAIVDDLAIVSDDNKTVGIELHIGWNHVVRRIFNALEYDVVKLDRVVYAGLDKKDLKRGQWRFLRNDEIVRLKHFK